MSFGLASSMTVNLCFVAERGRREGKISLRKGKFCTCFGVNFGLRERLEIVFEELDAIRQGVD